MASFGAKFPNFSPIKGEPENELPTYRCNSAWPPDQG